MKKVLIISPHFVPVNAADMHRIRQSLAYYEQNGWLPEVVMVDEKYVEGTRDYLLSDTIPKHIKIHKVKAWSTTYTRKIGLGNIAMRSFMYYYNTVNKLLADNSYDLIFFSTTAYQICALGRVWKKKYKVPYLIDMQDPWRSDHYLHVPKKERPPKFWFSYLLDSCLERWSINKVNGLMAVSKNYIDVLKRRYPKIQNVPEAVIPFAAYEKDFELTKTQSIENPFFKSNGEEVSMVYIGRAGFDMEKSIRLILLAIKKGMQVHEHFKKIKLYFIGTSYDPTGNAKKEVHALAQEIGISDTVVEATHRIPYFQSLKVLADANVLMVPGSVDPSYTASKIYGYVWLNKPMFTVFHSKSSVNKFMEDVNAGLALKFDLEEEDIIIDKIVHYINVTIESGFTSPKINREKYEEYCSPYQVRKQVDLFNDITRK